MAAYELHQITVKYPYSNLVDTRTFGGKIASAAIRASILRGYVPFLALLKA